jgi:LysR family glycine cleavage system transcriptional activator
MRRLPPLNALRAFEAAARHLSFKKAAEELHVTPAAVSHQVKALEDYLGVSLFRRLTRALALTKAGENYYPPVRDGFDRFASATGRLLAEEGAGPLTVSTTIAFAAKWLVPRLNRLHDEHPEIDVRIHATDEIVDFARDNVDVAIRYGPGRYPGLHAERFFGDEVYPVCNPGLIDGSPPLRKPDDLRHHTLLHFEWVKRVETDPSWRLWLRAAGVAGIDTTRGLKFNDESMAVQAAIDGDGVALCSSVLVADDLAEGRLVKPFDVSLEVEHAYYLVYPQAAFNPPKVTAFHKWIDAEALKGEGLTAAKNPK